MFRRLVGTVGWQIAMALGLGVGVSTTEIRAQEDATPELSAVRLAQVPEPPPSLEGPAAPGPVEMPPPNAEQEGVDVLTRGPVHEAFAEPLAEQPEGSLVVAKQPPKEVEEVPPEVKPEGDDVVWIPGYWAWDDDRKDFIWISGIWRKSPPNRQWVPGYWTQADDGWQWVPGLWAAEEAEELHYREPPPRTLEAGPSSPMPSDSHFWVPGCWLWYESGYRWRPGFWSPYRTDWVWVPAHWAWTPRGCLFVPGYWDYRMTHRGHLYAPVYFHPGVWHRPHFRYSPWCVVDAGPLMLHFWIRPRYHHYYFGDYYGPSYVSLGFSPWSRWDYRRDHRHWDPLMAHYDAHYRHTLHIDYSSRMQQWHGYYDKHLDERPRHTYADQVKFIATRPQNISPAMKQSLMATHVDVVAKRPDAHIVRLPPDRRDAFLAGSHQVRQFTDDRRTTEKPGSGHGPPGGPAKLSPTGEKPAVGGKPPSGGNLKLPKTIGVPPSRIQRPGTPPALETQKMDHKVREGSKDSSRDKLPAGKTPSTGPGTDSGVHKPREKLPTIKSPATGLTAEPVKPQPRDKTPAVKLPATSPSTEPAVKTPSATPGTKPATSKPREREPAVRSPSPSPQPKIDTPRPRSGPSSGGGSEKKKSPGIRQTSTAPEPTPRVSPEPARAVLPRATVRSEPQPQPKVTVDRTPTVRERAPAVREAPVVRERSSPRREEPRSSLPRSSSSSSSGGSRERGSEKSKRDRDR